MNTYYEFMEDDQEKQFEHLQNHHLHHHDHFLRRTPHLNDGGYGTGLPMKNSGMLKIKLISNSNVSNKEYGEEEKDSRVGDVCNKNFSSKKALGHEEEEEYNYDNNDNDEITWKRIKNEKQNHKQHQQIFVDVSAATSAAAANYINLSSDNNNDSTCRVCGKTFPSRKSLFDSRQGHKVDDPMVIDSTRENTMMKRKMKPSAPTPRRGLRSLGDTGDLNNNEKNAVDDYSDAKEQENLDDEYMVPADPGVYHLMMLVMASAQSESTPPDSSALQSAIKQRRNNRSQQDDYSNNYSCSEVEEESKMLNCNKRLKIGDYPRGGLSLKKKKKKRFRVHNKESEIGYIYDRTSKVIVGDSDKTMKLKDLARVVDDGGDDVRKQEMEFNIAGKFNCTSCNKSFPSHQALGGHRSSHKSNKINQLKYKSNIEEVAAGGLVMRRESDDHEEDGLVKNDNANIKQTLEDFSIQVKNVESISNSKSKLMAAAMTSIGNINMQTYRCNICGKTFPTALGGHKRHHGIGPSPSPSVVVNRPPPPPSSSSSVGSAEDFSKSNISTNTTITTNTSTTATTERGHRVMFDFDLNELPVMEE
ncbi:hypothetical protein MKX01_020138 [Papaver californicum]|nr:hypothetical protein MKX01_020138 [Papaver californicum]